MIEKYFITIKNLKVRYFNKEIFKR